MAAWDADELLEAHRVDRRVEITVR